MKRAFLIVLGNIIIFVFLFLLIEFIIWFFIAIEEYSEFHIFNPFKLFKEKISIAHFEKEFKRPAGLTYPRPPILLYGCSFAYGVYLDDKESPEYILSEITKRPVYNFALSARGLQHALYIIRNQKINFPNNTTPDYIIYVLYSDQIRRLFESCGLLVPEQFLTYKIKDNKIIFDDNNSDVMGKFIENTYLYRMLQKKIINKTDKYNKEYDNKIVKLFITQIIDEANNKYPNAKFILICYNDIFDENNNIFIQYLKQIDNPNFEIINLPDLFGHQLEDKEYIIPNDVHPNAKAWKLIFNKIAEMENI